MPLPEEVEAKVAEEGREGVPPSSSLPLLLQALLPAAVVQLPLLRVRQGLVGRPEVLELLVGVRVVRVPVRVHLLGHLAVGLLDLVGVGALGHAKDAVEVATKKRNNYV